VSLNDKAHWETIYRTKRPDQVSWFQREATLSLALIRKIEPRPTARIIDVGGGASTLIDGLLHAGYRNLTVLDLSSTALAEVRRRLGPEGADVTWLEADVLDATLPSATFDVWHDRAVFHFLIAADERARYVEQAQRAMRPGGYVVVATFAHDGPTYCSGLPVARYTPASLHQELGPGFRLLQSAREEHMTPAGGIQPFVYCLCQVLAATSTDVAG
jgi:ubiquinone/menaquinone biosynthesis C-methylase UbiE